MVKPGTGKAGVSPRNSRLTAVATDLEFGEEVHLDRGPLRRAIQASSAIPGLLPAVTIDGRHWTLYVRGECLYDDLEQFDDPGVMVPDVKYGSWSPDNGFQRAPIRMPTFDDRVRAHGERLLEAVRQHAPSLPFALADRFELWLLHAVTGRPLALIASRSSWWLARA